MASFVNAADVAAAAVEIEKRGHEFYLSVRDSAMSADDKTFFAFMAEEEQKHEVVFAEMLKRLGGIPFPAGSQDEEYFAYVQDLLDSHTLFVAGQKERAVQSPLGMAIQLEKDTLLFFMAIEKLVPESERKYVVACADEERKHLRMLTARLTHTRA